MTTKLIPLVFFEELMLCETASDISILKNPNYLFQIKYDGEIAYYNPRVSELINKHKQFVTQVYPEISQAMSQQKISRCVVGEIVVGNHYPSLQKRTGQTNPLIIRQLLKNLPAQFIIFDVISDEPFEDRQRWLYENVQEDDTIRIAETFEDGQKVWDERVIPEQLEGLVAKRKGSLYHAGKSLDQQKIKYWKEKVIRIGSYELNNESITAISLKGDRVKALKGDRVKVYNHEDVSFIKTWVAMKGYCDIVVLYLEITSNDKLRKIHFKEVLKNDRIRS